MVKPIIAIVLSALALGTVQTMRQHNEVQGDPDPLALWSTAGQTGDLE